MFHDPPVLEQQSDFGGATGESVIEIRLEDADYSVGYWSSRTDDDG